MNVKQWLHANKCAKDRALMAAAADTTVSYLWQLAGGHRGCNRNMAERLCTATGGEIAVIDAMLPDLADSAVPETVDVFHKSA